MDYSIRLATKDDCEQLAKIKHDVWCTTYKGIYSDEKINNFDYERNKEKFLDIINNPQIRLYVVEVEGKIIGYMDCGFPLRPFKNYEREIGLLYVLKEFQGKGIGRKLFDIAYNQIKEEGYQEFFISCNKYNYSAHKFYEKMGGKLIDVDDDNKDKSIPQVKFLYKIK